MKDITTIQLSKNTLIELNKTKLQYEARLGKRVSMNEYIKELIRYVRAA